MAFVTAREYVLSPLTRVSSSRSRSSNTRFVRFMRTSVLQGRPESYLYLARACLRGGSASGSRFAWHLSFGLGRTAEARSSCERALSLAKQEPERRFWSGDWLSWRRRSGR